MPTASFITGGLSLYLDANLNVTNQLGLFLEASPSPTSSQLGLYTWSTTNEAIQSELSLYCHGGHGSLTNSLGLFAQVTNTGNASNTLPLYLFSGATSITASLGLYIGDGITCWPTWENWNIPFQDANQHDWDCGDTFSCYPRFQNWNIPWQDNNLYAWECQKNLGEVENSLTLICSGEGNIPCSSILPLFLNCGTAGHLTLYCMAPNLHTSNSLTLYADGNGNITQGISLFAATKANLTSSPLDLYASGY